MPAMDGENESLETGLAGSCADSRICEPWRLVAAKQWPPSHLMPTLCCDIVNMLPANNGLVGYPAAILTAACP
eukprot:4096635-Pleurochrysis_carterae.AAC.1